jgi:hypothetical protein
LLKKYRIRAKSNLTRTGQLRSSCVVQRADNRGDDRFKVRARHARDGASSAFDSTGVERRAGRGRGRNVGAGGTLSDELAPGDVEAGRFAVEGFALGGGEEDFGFEAL